MASKAKTLTGKQAYEIASQWGSYMRDGDPGSVFYTFSHDKAVVQSEEHRAKLVAYTADCILQARTSRDRSDLRALLVYFRTATLPHPPLDEFTSAYVTAALWSSSDMDAEDGDDTPLDANYSEQDIAPSTLAEMVADCERFQVENAALLTDDNFLQGSRFTLAEIAGHDFWLTRNHHGSGFWDGGWEKAAGDALTKAAHRFGGVDLYVGDGGQIHA